MHIELVESLRCPNPHEFTWLVASTLEMAGRDIRRGLLGCPSCGARYPIRDGVVDFLTRDGTTPLPQSGHLPPPSADSELALRVAALLDLTSPGGFVVLAGEWAHAAAGLPSVTEGVELLVLNAPVNLSSGNGISLARTDGAIPIRPGAARGIALDQRHGPQAAGAARALKQFGRLVAPLTAALPADVEELARDGREWVGTKRSETTEPVPLRKG
ncbi:MAG: Trm112 family protein [Gemmatimonadaceae bacterium]